MRILTDWLATQQEALLPLRRKIVERQVAIGNGRCEQVACIGPRSPAELLGPVLGRRQEEIHPWSTGRTLTAVSVDDVV
jgi:hypothetical protein